MNQCVANFSIVFVLLKPIFRPLSSDARFPDLLHNSRIATQEVLQDSTFGTQVFARSAPGFSRPSTTTDARRVSARWPARPLCPGWSENWSRALPQSCGSGTKLKTGEATSGAYASSFPWQGFSRTAAKGRGRILSCYRPSSWPFPRGGNGTISPYTGMKPAVAAGIGFTDYAKKLWDAVHSRSSQLLLSVRKMTPRSR